MVIVDAAENLEPRAKPADVAMEVCVLIRVVVPLEVLIATQKPAAKGNVEKCLERFLTPSHIVLVVPNQPHPDKVVLSLRITRALKRRVEKAAKLHGMSVTDFVEWSLTTSVRDVTLSPDDYRQIAEATALAAKGGGSDQRLRDARAAREAAEAGGRRAS